VGCPTCPCPEIQGKFTKNLCQTQAGVKTLLDANYFFKIANPEIRGDNTCVYQARVSIYGDDKLLFPDGWSEEDLDNLCIGSSDEGFSDVFEIEYPGEVELMSELTEFKNYAFDGIYEKIEITLDVFRNTSDEPFSDECSDYTPAEKEECDYEEDGSVGSSDPCACTWKSKSSDIEYEETTEYHTETCKIPRCYPCGHDVTASALVDQVYIGSSYEESESDNSKDTKQIRTYILPSVYPFFANVEVDYYVKGMNVYTKTLNASTASELKPGTQTTNVAEVTLNSKELGVPVSESDLIEVEVKSIESECECDCIFGWRNKSGTDTAYIPENTLNTELTDTETNYYNCVCAFGNCTIESESNESQEKNWFRYSINLGNLLSNKFGHNCKYSLQLSLKLGTDEKYFETVELDLSKLVKDVDTDVRSKIKDYTLEKTIELDASGGISTDNAIFKVCAISGSSTTEDGYTNYPSTTEYDCDCCQEYDYRYFNDYIESEPEKCTPCSKDDVVESENFSVENYNHYYYNSEMTGTFLMYAKMNVSGNEHKILLGNGTNESYIHKIYLDTLSEDGVESIQGSSKIIQESIM
jgi:hypothetical protein